MGKLHEVLAVEASLKTTAEKVTKEAVKTFSDRHDHFVESHRAYQPKDDEGTKFPPESKPMVTTVPDKLNYVQAHFENMLDAVYQKEFANTEAKADILVGETIIAKDVPATFLLTLEKELNNLRKIYEKMPTLDPGKVWKKDTTKDNVYVADPVKTNKTEKTMMSHVAYEATKDHPAQVQVYNKDIVVGEWTNKEWSGCVSVSDKSKYLGKIDELHRAVKKARMRANEVEVKNLKIGKKFFDFINK